LKDYLTGDWHLDERIPRESIGPRILKSDRYLKKGNVIYADDMTNLASYKGKHC